VMVGSSPERSNDDNTGSPSSPPPSSPSSPAYEVEGWQRGFDVQFNGVGRVVEAGENEDDSSDWESDDSDEGEENRPEGYSALASEPPSQLRSCSITTSDDTSHREMSSQMDLSLNKHHSVLPETATSIRNAVAGLKLPAPAWANEVTDSQLLEMITKMQGK
ncbi:hypothetical protein PENTCL1PPCAC_2323, partial [Pristionchus entomophagus]